MSRIPFYDLVRLNASVGESLAAAYEATVSNAAFVGGAAVSEFEAAFAGVHLRTGSVGCGSGTDALALALRALGVGPGDEVIVPSLTFVATAEAVLHVGAHPVMADVDEATLLLSEEGVDAVRTERSRAVIPVHLYGHVVPFDRLAKWRREGLYVIEDAAQAHQATCNGQPVGTEGDAACFSFYPGKNLGALGDGGAVVSDDVELLRRVRQLRDHGRTTKYEHETVGWCSRLDGLQAAFLLTKLDRLAAWNCSRVSLAERYGEQLRHVDNVRLVPWTSGAVHHLLVTRLPALLRPAVRRRLSEAGIGTGLHYPIPLSLQPSLATWRRPCPNAEVAASEVLSLPMDPLMTVAEVDMVCEGLAMALDEGETT